MKEKVTDILLEAKDIVWNNKMQSFIAVFIPVILGGLGVLLSLLLGRLGLILMLFVVIAVVYSTTRMQLSVVRTGKADLDESLQDFSRAFKLFGYFLLVGLFFLLIMFGLIYALVWDEVLAFIDFMNSLDGVGVGDVEALTVQIDSFMADFRLIGVIFVVINVIFTLKFFMVQYLIVDGTGVFESIKRSWNETTSYLGTIFLVTVFFVVANELLGLVSLVMSKAGALGAIYELAYLVFAIIFWVAYQAMVPAHLYNKMIGGNRRSRVVVEEDVFTGSQEQNKDEEWDF